MKQFTKDVVAEFRKSVINQIVAWIGAVLVASSTTTALWGSILSLSPEQLSSLRYLLLFSGGLCLGLVGWLLFIRTFRKLQVVEKQLQDLLKSPRQITDDYEHLKDRGFWVHRKTGERVCANCLLSGIVSPLAALSFGTKNLWVCGRKECGKRYHYRAGDLKETDA